MSEKYSERNKNGRLTPINPVLAPKGQFLCGLAIPDKPEVITTGSLPVRSGLNPVRQSQFMQPVNDFLKAFSALYAAAAFRAESKGRDASPPAGRKSFP